MRKLVCLLAVAMLAAPAIGGDITFTAEEGDPCDGVFQIGYSATTDGPSAFALVVTLSGSCTGTVTGLPNVVSSSSEFDVHIDYASEDPCNYTVDPAPAGQHPLADPCRAGVPDGPISQFTVCMGRVDPCNPSPLSVAKVVEIRPDFTGSCTLTVDIELDNLRGGVVGATYGTVNLNDGTVDPCAGGEPPCTEGRPPCWCEDAQCNGEFVINGDVDTVDWPIFRGSFGRNYCDDWNGGAGPYNPCADLDQDGDVDTVDWPYFRGAFGKPAVGGCQDLPSGGDTRVIPGSWPPTCP